MRRKPLDSRWILRLQPWVSVSVFRPGRRPSPPHLSTHPPTDRVQRSGRSTAPHQSPPLSPSSCPIRSQNAWSRTRRGGALHGCHVTLTSSTWSSVLGSTRTCCVWLELNTWPGLKGSSRGMGRALCCCSLLPTE